MAVIPRRPPDRRAARPMRQVAADPIRPLTVNVIEM
jgi:hypothetical protein